MEWQTDPLLREEIEAPAHRGASSYAWSQVSGLSVLTYQGHPIGRVHGDGRYSLTWRTRVHEGKAAPPKQAKRFMTRWIAARGQQSPVRPGYMPPSTLVPLADFLRDYDAGKY